MSAPEDNSVYFVLSSVVSRTTARFAREPDLPWGSDLWIDGAPLRGVIPQPLIFEIEAGDEGEMGAFIETPAPLMSIKLVKTLQACGVDNLATYDAVIRELATGKEYTDYVAVNVLGVIDAVDRTRAVSTSLEGLGTWFSNLSIDEHVTGGALLFRLKQSLSKVIVHRRIKDAVEAEGFPLLRFRPTEGLAG